MSWRDTIQKPAEGSAGGGWRSTITKPKPQSTGDKLLGYLSEAPIAPGFSIKDAASTAMSGLQKIGEAVDPYTGAPVRAGLMAGIEGNDPLSAAYGAIGKPSDSAPSGKDIVRKLGVPDTSLSDVLPSLYSESGEGLALEKGGLLDPTASGAAGLGVDVAADWTNLVPFGAAANVIKKAAKTTDVGQAVSRVPRAAGLAAKEVGDTASSAVSALSKHISPRQAPEFPAAVKTAEKYGMDPKKVIPPSLEFGPESYISRASRSVAEGPVGESLLRDYKTANEAVGSKIDDVVSGAAQGKPLDLASAGTAIKEGYGQAKDAILGGDQLTYKKVLEYAPGFPINREAQAKLTSKLNGVEKYAKGLIARGHPQFVAQGRYLLKEVQQARNAKNLKQTVEHMQQLGEATFKTKYQPNVTRPDLAKNKEIYFAQRDAVLDTVHADINPEFATEIKGNNKKISEFLTNSEEFENLLDKAPEQIVSLLASDTKRLNAFKKSVAPETFARLKGAYLHDMVMPLRPKNPAEQFPFGRLARDIDRDSAVLKNLLEPKEYEALKELADFGASFGEIRLGPSSGGVAFLSALRGIFDGSVTKHTIEMMKRRARSLGPAPAPKAAKPKPKATAPKPPPVDKPGPGLLPRMAGKRKGLIGQTIKGSQSLTPSGLLEEENEQ